MSSARVWLIVLCAACGLGCAEESPDEPVLRAPAASDGERSDAGARTPAPLSVAAGGNAEGPRAAGAANAGTANAGTETGAAIAADAGTDLAPAPDGGRGQSEPPAEADVALSFADDVHPIFSRRCGPCHTTQHIARHDVGGALPGAYVDALALGQTLLARIDGGSMPPTCDGAPGSPGCLSGAEVELVRRWLEQGSPP